MNKKDNLNLTFKLSFFLLEIMIDYIILLGDNNEKKNNYYWELYTIDDRIFLL